MGTQLKKTDPGTMTLSAVDAKVGTFISQAGNAQLAIVKSLNSGNELLSSFAKADACRMIIAATDDDIRSYLASIADARIGMVEVVEPGRRPDESAIADVMCLAIMNGFVPGKDQFSVYGKKNGGASLYVKKSGYEKWFSHLSNCSIPDVKHEHPVYKKFGKGDKHNWVTEGFAQCVYNGKTYRVDRSGPHAIAIPGYDSDQISSVSTKVKRALLKELWQMLTNYALDDNDVDDDQNGSVTILDHDKIEGDAAKKSETKAAEDSPNEAFEKKWFAELKNLKPESMKFSKALHAAWTLCNLDAVEKMRVDIAAIADSRDRRLLELFADAIVLFVKEQVS